MEMFSPVGDQLRAEEMKEVSVFEVKKVRTGEKRRRKDKGDPADLDGYMGPWREYEDEVKVSKPTPEQMVILDEQFGEKLKAKEKKEDDTITESTILHVENPCDYLGRSYLHIRQDLDVDLRTEEPPPKCFSPKKLVHTWVGHTKGVAAIRLFPHSGHLVLSAGMDSKIKLWEVYGERRLLRTFVGHAKAVRDICFSCKGTRFLSCSYDRYIKLWDTETGECLARFTNKKTPYCVRFNPDEDKQNLFLVGCADKKIYCFNIDSGEIVQEYDRHLGAVNTITFVDGNRRFVTTSDDKSLRVWEWDIPVDMKYVAEPHMHSMPAVTLSPNEKWLACQSMDNTILVYGVHNNFRLNRKKNFKGHMVAGYACSADFSPEGSLVVSGDADGKLTVWEWRTTRIVTRFKAHDSVCISCLWLPHETSKVISCGWDGKIHLWD
ncbi:Pre-mRNA-processing factor 17 [Geodia barretti]|uniref:Pre-mRNA-processing factor 17 n=1 Tax=Geodia barretti TaxID=519541 RepID=A0AA35WLI0_GEOBA|nr:Pre-mRNA-processing factor 17 [Geodia barretti]